MGMTQSKRSVASILVRQTGGYKSYADKKKIAQTNIYFSMITFDRYRTLTMLKSFLFKIY
jgi:hypothetical protein